MNFPKTLKFKETVLHDKVSMIRQCYKQNINLKGIVKMLGDIRSEKEFSLNELSEEEKKDLEKIQYETFIKLDMYVEALENSGIFYRNNSTYMKSSKTDYDEFYSQLRNREEDI